MKTPEEIARSRAQAIVKTHLPKFMNGTPRENELIDAIAEAIAGPSVGQVEGFLYATQQRNQWREQAEKLASVIEKCIDMYQDQSEEYYTEALQDYAKFKKDNL